MLLRGCLGGCAAVIILFIGVIALIAWVGSNSPSPQGGSAIQGSSDVASTDTASTNSATSSDAAEINGLSDRIKADGVERSSRNAALNKLIVAAMNQLNKRADFKAAVERSNLKLGYVIDARKNHSDDLPELSQEWIASKAVLGKLIADYLNTPEIRAAQKSVIEMDAEIENLRKQETVAQRKSEKDAEAEAEAEQQRIENDPINKAIREHRLIEGMSYEEAKEALGSPYSITQSGLITSATWEFGEGNFWSALFINDSIDSINHTAL